MYLSLPYECCSLYFDFITDSYRNVQTWPVWKPVTQFYLHKPEQLIEALAYLKLLKTFSPNQPKGVVLTPMKHTLVELLRQT